MSKQELNFMKDALGTLKEIQREFGDNTSLGTIVRSYEARIKEAEKSV